MVIWPFRRRREPEIERREPVEIHDEEFPEEHYEAPPRRPRARGGGGGRREGDLEQLARDFLRERYGQEHGWYDVIRHDSCLNPPKTTPKNFKDGLHIADHYNGVGKNNFLLRIHKNGRAEPVTSTHQELADAFNDWLNGG